MKKEAVVRIFQHPSIDIDDEKENHLHPLELSIVCTVEERLVKYVEACASLHNWD